MFTLYIQTKKLEYDNINIETVPRNHKVREATVFLINRVGETN